MYKNIVLTNNVAFADAVINSISPGNIPALISDLESATENKTMEVSAQFYQFIFLKISFFLLLNINIVR